MADCKEYQQHPLIKKKGKNKVVVLVDETKKKAVALDDKVEELKNTIFDTYFDLGLALKVMNDESLYREFGYESLEDYAQQRHGFKYRKAAYLIAIVENCWKAQLRREDIRGIEWSKMACLPELTDENRQEWLGKAKDMTVEQLKNEVKKDRGGGESEEKIFLSFSLGAPAKEVVDRALDLAAQLTGSKVKSFHLEVLAQEFIGTYEKMDDASVTRFQSIYGESEESSTEHD
ncbi:hypothetical protein KAR91_23395 [Candidatus Pacearchaeota archaeon]|nr:hypothetical protein [Candidatus Pacearchaeota archaeon]